MNNGAGNPVSPNEPADRQLVNSSADSPAEPVFEDLLGLDELSASEFAARLPMEELKVQLEHLQQDLQSLKEYGLLGAGKWDEVEALIANAFNQATENALNDAIAMADQTQDAALAMLDEDDEVSLPGLNGHTPQEEVDRESMYDPPSVYNRAHSVSDRSDSMTVPDDGDSASRIGQSDTDGFYNGIRLDDLYTIMEELDDAEDDDLANLPGPPPEPMPTADKLQSLRDSLAAAQAASDDSVIGKWDHAKELLGKAERNPDNKELVQQAETLVAELVQHARKEFVSELMGIALNSDAMTEKWPEVEKLIQSDTSLADLRIALNGIFASNDASHSFHGAESASEAEPQTFRV